MATRLNKLLRALWRFIRQVSGDDGYERYLARHATLHPDRSPLARGAWFAHQQQKKWAGVKRCC